MAKRRKQATARVWFWSRSELVRFVGAVEQLVCAVNDLTVQVDLLKRRRAASWKDGTHSHSAAGGAL